MIEKQQLTREGYKKLEDELRNLIDVVRVDVKRQLAEARAQGDLSENADYDAARARQAEVEGRIKEIENILSNSEIIDDEAKSKKGGNKVALGSTVTIKFVETGKEGKYMIVGTVESDPFNNKISNACPLGEALIGKVVGDVVGIYCCGVHVKAVDDHQTVGLIHVATGGEEKEQSSHHSRKGERIPFFFAVHDFNILFPYSGVDSLEVIVI